MANSTPRNEATAQLEASDAVEDGYDVIVIYDRAAPDGQAFADAECWAKLTKEAPVEPQQYDLVLELRSTALLANKSIYEFGPTAKNTARQHNREDAAAMGDKFMKAYAGHSFYHRIEAEPDIKVKFMNVVSALVDRLPTDMLARFKGSTVSELCKGQNWPVDDKAEAPRRAAEPMEDTQDSLFCATIREGRRRAA